MVLSLFKTLCVDLVGVLVHRNDEAVAEAARAFGNFSRHPSVRAYGKGLGWGQGRGGGLLTGSWPNIVLIDVDNVFRFGSS